MPLNDFLNASIILKQLKIYIIILIFESNLPNEYSAFQTNKTEPTFYGESPTSNRTTWVAFNITLGDRVQLFASQFFIYIAEIKIPTLNSPQECCKGEGKKQLKLPQQCTKFSLSVVIRQIELLLAGCRCSLQDPEPSEMNIMSFSSWKIWQKCIIRSVCCNLIFPFRAFKRSH